MSKKTALVVGGTSGLGLEIATLLLRTHSSVHVTGRTKYGNIHAKLHYHRLDLTPPPGESLIPSIRMLLTEIGKVDTLVYAAGFREDNTLPELQVNEVSKMISVGLEAPIHLLRLIIQLQLQVETMIFITSTSQWTARKKEPVYSATKAALGMLAESVSLDGRIKRTLVVGVAGMNTPFWDGSDKNTSSLLDPVWVAEQTLEQLEDEYAFRFVKVLYNPLRVIQEKERLI